MGCFLLNTFRYDKEIQLKHTKHAGSSEMHDKENDI